MPAASMKQTTNRSDTILDVHGTSEANSGELGCKTAKYANTRNPTAEARRTRRGVIAEEAEVRMDIYDELRSLLKALQRHGVSYALCGGLAMAVYGIVRATEDIDLLVEEPGLRKVREVGRALGFGSAQSRWS